MSIVHCIFTYLSVWTALCTCMHSKNIKCLQQKCAIWNAPPVNKVAFSSLTSRLWVPHPFRLPTCWTQQLKCTRQVAIKEPALFRPELNTPPPPRSLVCCRPPQPGGNCIAVSPLLMSCRRNCFTVWPLVFQTSAPVKDPRRADERWCMHVFLPVRLRVWWRPDKYVSPLMLPVDLVSSVLYIHVYIFLHILKCSSSPHHLKSSSWGNSIVYKSYDSRTTGLGYNTARTSCLISQIPFPPVGRLEK